nr:MAG TPA: Sodium/potassium-transporting ATPase subunit alpha-1 [Microviridae sp.]
MIDFYRILKFLFYYWLLFICLASILGICILVYNLFN